MMSVPKAVKVLEKSHLSESAALMQAASMAISGKVNAHLRKQPKGYSGIDGARALLNDMIFESLPSTMLRLQNVPSSIQSSVLGWRSVEDRFLPPTTWLQ